MKNLSFLLLFLFASLTTNAQVACRDVSISVSVGPVSVGTTVYVCCGGPYSGGSGCSFVNKRTFEMWTGGSQVSMRYNGIPIKELIPNQDVSNVKFIIVESSTISRLDDGTKISVKKGNYNVDNEGLVFLDLEIIK